MRFKRPRKEGVWRTNLITASEVLREHWSEVYEIVQKRHQNQLAETKDKAGQYLRSQHQN